MTDSRDNQYHDPGAPGSLTGALRLWQALQAADSDGDEQHLAFSFSCRSESRASRVAAFLRRRLACVMTQVRRVEAGRANVWRIDGSTQQEIQSLANLEDVSTWLRSAAADHQVDLIHFSVVGAAA